MVAGMRSSNITLVDPARVPARPAKPNVPSSTQLVRSQADFLLGICGALFRDATDSRIQELGEIELLFAEALLGLLPYHDAKAERKRLASVESKAGVRLRLSP